MIPFDEALELLLKDANRLGIERLPLEQSRGRVLAENIVATTPLPAFSHSAMDGFAVASADLDGPGPWVLPVRGRSRAGGAPPRFKRKTACRIFCGAEIPVGANAVIAQERLVFRDDDVVITEAPRAGQHIRVRGSDLAEGVTALAEGTRLGAGHIGLAACMDRPRLAVARQPVVTIVSTGDELRAPGDDSRLGSVIESNSYVVGSIAGSLGAHVRLARLLRDDPEQTREELGGALAAGTDVLITIGGVSVGDHDLVRPALAELGVKLDFTGVAIKPGKPVAAGRTDRCRALCLPGNPAAATATFVLFGVPLLRALQGEQHPVARPEPLRVLGSHVRKPGRQEYLRARVDVHDGEPCAVLLQSQSPGAVTGFAEADALVVVAAESARVEHGDRLPVLRFADLWCTP